MHDPIERVASWLRPAVPEDADTHRVIAQKQIDQILRFFSAPPHRFLTCEEVVALELLPHVAGQPEPLTVPKPPTPDETEIAAFKAKWEALNIGIPRCQACGCPERTQSHCDRWDCPHLLPDRSCCEVA